MLADLKPVSKYSG